MGTITNKKARFDYTILKEFEAGIELFGFEVKSLRENRGSLRGAYVIVRGGEAFLVGASIPAWQEANAPKEYDKDRPRRLLLHSKELSEIAQAEGQQGLTVVALSWHNNKRHIKLSIGIAQGKKKFDKREAIKARDIKREQARSLKNK